MKKVMIFGTFDILHKGHLYIFAQARKHGDYLIAVVARDKTVKDLKRGFHHNEKIRLKNIRKYVDKAVLAHVRQGNRYNNVIKFKPDVICLGYDQTHFVDGLKRFKKIKIVRLRAYKPNIYKSSKMREKLSS